MAELDEMGALGNAERMVGNTLDHVRSIEDSSLVKAKEGTTSQLSTCVWFYQTKTSKMVLTAPYDFK